MKTRRPPATLMMRLSRGRRWLQLFGALLLLGGLAVKVSHCRAQEAARDSQPR